MHAIKAFSGNLLPRGTLHDRVAHSFAAEPASTAEKRTDLALCDIFHWGPLKLTKAWVHAYETNDADISPHPHPGRCYTRPVAPDTPRAGLARRPDESAASLVASSTELLSTPRERLIVLERKISDVKGELGLFRLAWHRVRKHARAILVAGTAVAGLLWARAAGMGPRWIH